MAIFNFGAKTQTYTQREVDEMTKQAATKAVEQTLQATNNSTTSNLRNHLSSIISGGYDQADTLHNVYLDYGYPSTLKFANFWNMYRRFGIAKNVVELIPEHGWSSAPKIEAPENVLRELDRLHNRLNLWARLKGVDTRQRVGRYAGLFMRVRDGLQPDQPIQTTMSGEAALMDIIPLYESQLEVLTTDNNPASENYGQPTMYQYNSSVTGNRNEKTLTSYQIHPSRIVIASEEADSGMIYGFSSMEAVYNSLMDLRKIIGAGGEGFYKNAAQSVIFKLTETQNAAQLSSLLEDFNEQYDEFVKNRFRRAMWTPALDPQTLESNLANPKEFFESALNDVAAGTKIPATILIGQQTGRLASQEDGRSFLSMVQSRRVNFGTDLVNDVIDWMQEYGILPRSDFEVEWDDLLAQSDEQKLSVAKKMSEINKDQFTSGGDIPFAGEEIREMAGFEPDELPEADETIDEDADSEPEAE